MVDIIVFAAIFVIIGLVGLAVVMASGKVKRGGIE